KEGTPYFFTLGAHDCLWFVLEKAQHRVDHERKLPVISLSTWHDLLDTPVLETLERKVLEDYFLRMRWFGGKGRTIEDIRITDHLILNETEFSSIIFLIEVRYESRLPETYQLPVSFGSDTFQQKLLDTCPQSVIARLQIGEVDGVLYDGIYGLELQEELLMKMASHETATREDSEIVFYGNDLLSEHVRQQDRIRPRVLGGEQSNTSIIYDNKFFLKLFRKVDQAINPDLELTRFLSEQARITNIPAFVGAIEWRFEKNPMVLGLLQELVEASGDAWTFMLERLDTFNENILAQPEIIKPSAVRGTIIDPVEYEH